MFFKKRNEIRELKKKVEEYAGKLYLADLREKKLNSHINTIKALAKEDKERILFLERENCRSLEEMKKIVKKLDEKENARKKLASSKGGQMLVIKKLQKNKKELEELLEKKEKDYLFALKVLFRKSRMTTDTKAFLGQRMKDLLTKYEKNRGDNNGGSIRY